MCFVRLAYNGFAFALKQILCFFRIIRDDFATALVFLLGKNHAWTPTKWHGPSGRRDRPGLSGVENIVEFSGRREISRVLQDGRVILMDWVRPHLLKPCFFSVYTLFHRECGQFRLCLHENFEKFEMISTPTGSWIRSRRRRDRIQLPVVIEIILNFSKFSWTKERNCPHSRWDTVYLLTLCNVPFHFRSLCLTVGTPRSCGFVVLVRLRFRTPIHRLRSAAHRASCRYAKVLKQILFVVFFHRLNYMMFQKVFLAFSFGGFWVNPDEMTRTVRVHFRFELFSDGWIQVVFDAPCRASKISRVLQDGRVILMDWVRPHLLKPCFLESILCPIESVGSSVSMFMKILKNSRWFRPRRAVGFDRASGAIESNFERFFQNFHADRDGTVHTLDEIEYTILFIFRFLSLEEHGSPQRSTA